MDQHRVVLDEGGVRHTLGDEHRYFPYASIDDIELRTRLLRDPVLVFLEGESEHVVFAGPDALEIHKALVEHASSARPGAPAHWPREGRALDAWLASLDTSTSYRSSGDIVARALGVLEDATAAVEDRAAAAHLLVRSAENDDLVAAAKVFASRTLPPLVVAAAHLAEGGVALTNDDVLAFLSPADRAAWDAHHRPTSERHELAAAEAKRQVEAEARQVANVAHEKRSTSNRPAAAYRDMSTWIGKSWGI